MSSRSSIEDLFESGDLDSDDTVDLSVPSRGKSLCASEVVIIESDSEAELSADHTSHLQNKKLSSTDVSSLTMDQKNGLNFRRTASHALSSSESENENPYALKKRISVDVRTQGTDVKKLYNHSSETSKPLVLKKHDASTSHVNDYNHEPCTDSSTVVITSESVETKHKETRNVATDGRNVCQYGLECYRKNPDHHNQFWHPADESKAENSSPAKKSRLENACSSSNVQKVASSLENSPDVVFDKSLPLSFLLTKVRGIQPRFNQLFTANIKDLLSPAHGKLLRSAQFNYCIDIDWLVAQYPPQFRTLPLLVIHGASREEKIQLDESGAKYSQITMCQAKLDIAFGTHHTKMMLLLYENGLRVVIHTANLIEGDWDQKTQGVWVSPIFAQLSAVGNDGPGDSETHFKQDLVQYLLMYKRHQINEWVDIIKQHDLSAAKVFLIASTPGRHVGDSKNHYGHLKLKQVLNTYGPDVAEVGTWPVIGQFSSIGSLGTSAENWLCSEWLNSLAAGQNSKGLLKKPSLHLVFPSVDNVRNSLEGYMAGGSLPYSMQTAAKQPYLRTFLHQWKSDSRGRSRASPHIKTYVRVSPDSTRLAWFLVTSANLSKAAWGCLEKNTTQLMIRSYELGVLFIPRSFGATHFSTSLKQVCDSSSSDIEFPVPYDLPITPYTSDDQPWMWDRTYSKPDITGHVWSPS